MQQYTTLCYITLHFTTLITHYTTPQLQLQLHYTKYTTLQLQVHYTTTTTTTALHHTTCSSCGWDDHCNHCSHSKKHNSNHLAVHQWIRSAIRDSQQLTYPIVSYLWNFRHRLVRYYWYYMDLLLRGGAACSGIPAWFLAASPISRSSSVNAT